tara:strand:- start:287 stop:622 length:336 start_codon:yes stop_codon:yes gene_type:complete
MEQVALDGIPKIGGARTAIELDLLGGIHGLVAQPVVGIAEAPPFAAANLGLPAPAAMPVLVREHSNSGVSSVHRPPAEVVEEFVSQKGGRGGGRGKGGGETGVGPSFFRRK